MKNRNIVLLTGVFTAVAALTLLTIPKQKLKTSRVSNISYCCQTDATWNWPVFDSHVFGETLFGVSGFSFQYAPTLGYQSNGLQEEDFFTKSDSATSTVYSIQVSSPAGLTTGTLSAWLNEKYPGAEQQSMTSAYKVKLIHLVPIHQVADGYEVYANLHGHSVVSLFTLKFDPAINPQPAKDLESSMKSMVEWESGPI